MRNQGWRAALPQLDHNVNQPRGRRARRPEAPLRPPHHGRAEAAQPVGVPPLVVEPEDAAGREEALVDEVEAARGALCRAKHVPQHRHTVEVAVPPTLGRPHHATRRPARRADAQPQLVVLWRGGKGGKP